ncbi:MAG: glutaredoxin domain-containing protein [Pseudobdellovibrionaceae bacterium]
MSPKVLIYSKQFCPYCVRAKEFFKQNNIAFQEIDLTDNFSELDKLKKKTGHMTVPQIFINEVFIGGYTDLIAKVNSGELRF